MTREELSRKNMKDTGIRIREYDVASVYEYHQGTQVKPKSKQELFTNSYVLVEFLLKNGLIIKKDGATNDIVSLDFSRGTLSTEARINWFRERGDSSKHYAELLEHGERLNTSTTTSVENIESISKEDLRRDVYENGFKLYKSNGDCTTYKRLYRSAGLAKKGKCIFIKERLYDKVRNFMKMHLKDIENEDIKLVEMETYMSLITSKNDDKIQIDPHNILILKDVDSYFKTTVLSVEKDTNGHLIANKKDNYEVKNTLFDGQGLISTSLFDDDHKKGFVLLRQHMFKVACFKTNIELFFRDKLGENWQDVELTDMFGRKIKAKDVKLITTDNAVKWKKFEEFTIDHWIKCVNETNNWFGIVKSDHHSKDDNLQKMSYQMVNSLDYDIVDDPFRDESRRYLLDLKNNDELFLKFLKNHASNSNRYGALYTLAYSNSLFMNVDLFKEFRSDIISNLLRECRKGRVFQNGDNLTFVGSPYALLLHAIGEDVENDDTLIPEDGVIQCYTTRFDNNTKLAVFRSPHNAQNNIGYLHNIHSEKMKRYFSFSDNILAINVRHTDFQDRLNGCDFDSDMGFVTDQKDVVRCAKRCYRKCPTIVNNVAQITKKYKNNISSYITVDNQIADSQTWIGESSNLSQLSQTYMHSSKNKESKQKYADICAILSVVAQIAIDSAKRSFDIDVTKEIKYLRKELDIDTKKYPKFWKLTHEGFSSDKINCKLKCPMGKLDGMKLPRGNKRETIKFGELLKDIKLKPRARITARALIKNISKNYMTPLIEFETRFFNADDFNYTKEEYHKDTFALRQQVLYDCKHRYSKVLNSEKGAGIYSFILSLLFEVPHQDKTEEDVKWFADIVNTKLKKGRIRTALLNILIDINSEVFAKSIDNK